VSRIEDYLAALEADDPAEGIKETIAFLEEEMPTEEEKSKLSYGLATAYFRLDEPEEVVRWLEETEDDRSYQLLGFNLIKMEDYEEAARAFRKAARHRPEDEKECQLLEAQALALAGEHDRARELLDGLLELDVKPDFRAECRLNRGTIEVEAGEEAKARQWFEDILDSDDSHRFKSEAAFHMVRIATREGQFDEAIEYAEWLKNEGREQRWREVGMDYLRKIKKERRKRRNKLRDYEY